jgi:hypothetical protein
MSDLADDLAIHVCAEQHARIKRLQADLDTARKERDAYLDRLTELRSVVVGLQAVVDRRAGECIHCGQTLPREALNHWETCPKHPARAVLDAVARCYDEWDDGAEYHRVRINDALWEQIRALNGEVKP